MRKTAALGMLLTFVLVGISPISAQRSVGTSVKQDLTRSNGFSGLRAITDGSGVLVSWQSQDERSVAGYNIYRVASGSKELANPAIVPGSLPHTGGDAVPGEMRQFFDVDGSAGAQYVVEGLRFDGTRFLSAAIPLVAVKSVEAETGTSSEAFRTAALSVTSNIESRTSTMTRELSDLVSLYAQQSDPVNQRVIGAKAGAKIAVKQDGFYRVTSAELQAANFPVSSDSSKWRLFANGVEQSIIVAADQSYIEFYGRGLDIADTDTRIYYLIADTVPGKRIGTKLLRTIPGSAPARNYPVVATKKQRTSFNPTIFNGDEENFLGDLFFQGLPKTIRFNLSGVDFSVPEATVSVRFFGNQTISDYQHEVRAKINGLELPPIRAVGNVLFSGQFPVTTSNLREGENVLELTSSAPNDFNYFDKIEVGFKRSFSAESSRISFSTPGSRKISLSGFSTSAVRVFDLTFEGDPVLLAGTRAVEASEGFEVQVPSTRAMVGYAFEDSALLQSPSVTANAPSSLSAATRNSEMLIITHPTFIRAAQSWADYRRSAVGGGLRVNVIDVTDIYDEFGYGIPGGTAIKNLLDYASTSWAAAPKYVLLMGDGSRDPRGYEGVANMNLIPSRTVQLQFEEAPSDEALGDFDDDGLSSIAIGRIPARTSAQVSTALDKTIRFEANQVNLNRGVLFAHLSDPEFESMSQQLSQRLATGTPVTMVSTGEANASDNLVNAVNQGNFMVNYSGHGATGFWANTDFFTVNTVSQLTNIDHPSVFAMLTCKSGYFERPDADSIAERLLFSTTGGAAASWASTSQTTSDFQLFMAESFFQDLSDGREARIGDMIKEAKRVIDAGADVRLSWALLGDPMLRMP